MELVWTLASVFVEIITHSISSCTARARRAQFSEKGVLINKRVTAIVLHNTKSVDIFSITNPVLLGGPPQWKPQANKIVKWDLLALFLHPHFIIINYSQAGVDSLLRRESEREKRGRVESAKVGRATRQ